MNLKSERETIFSKLACVGQKHDTVKPHNSGQLVQLNLSRYCRAQCAVGFSNQNKKDQKVCQFS